MSYNAIIDDDWSDYNLRKRRIGMNIFNFSPDQGWEVNYLIDKILKYYPYQNVEAIKNALNTVQYEDEGAYRREVIIKKVLDMLCLN